MRIYTQSMSVKIIAIPAINSIFSITSIFKLYWAEMRYKRITWATEDMRKQKNLEGSWEANTNLSIIYTQLKRQRRMSTCVKPVQLTPHAKYKTIRRYISLSIQILIHIVHIWNFQDQFWFRRSKQINMISRNKHIKTSNRMSFTTDKKQRKYRKFLYNYTLENGILLHNSEKTGWSLGHLNWLIE